MSIQSDERKGGPVTSDVFSSSWTEAPDVSSSCVISVEVTVVDEAHKDSSKLLRLDDTAGTVTTERSERNQTFNIKTFGNYLTCLSFIFGTQSLRTMCFGVAPF